MICGEIGLNWKENLSDQIQNNLNSQPQTRIEVYIMIKWRNVKQCEREVGHLAWHYALEVNGADGGWEWSDMLRG